MSQARLNVKLLNHSQDIEKTIAMAGKLCYSSSTIEELGDKLTEENVNKFIKMIMDIGHESVLEHCTFTFAVEGVSRSLSHQLVRHRIASYSQQSQRYVKLEQFEYIIPKDIENIPELKERYIKDMEQMQNMYNHYVKELMNKYIDDYCIKNNIHTAEGFHPSQYDFGLNEFYKLYPKEYNKLEKKAIENARYVFPNACETKIIVTMNIRSLINFFQHRCCNRAQEEIRDMANEMLKLCREVSPLIFNNIGAACYMTGKCPEGKMSCGQIQK